LGEEIKESIIVRKVLRSLTMRFDPKILVLEEREDISMLSMDELHEILISHEMRIEQVIHPRRKQRSRHPRKQRRINMNQSQIQVAIVVII
jgi:hypothetical protein